VADSKWKGTEKGVLDVASVKEERKRRAQTPRVDADMVWQVCMDLSNKCLEMHLLLLVLLLLFCCIGTQMVPTFRSIRCHTACS
jgi:hypothetical protein